MKIPNKNFNNPLSSERKVETDVTEESLSKKASDNAGIPIFSEIKGEKE